MSTIQTTIHLDHPVNSIPIPGENSSVINPNGSFGSHQRVEDLTSPVADAGKLFLLCFLGIYEVNLHPVNQPARLGESQSTYFKSYTPSLTVAGFGFRTIGRLDNRQTGQAIHFTHPLESTISINHLQSDRGGLRLQDNRQTGESTVDKRPQSTAHLEPPYTSNTHVKQSDRGGLRLQDNRQTGQPSTSINHFDHPLRPSTSNHRIHQIHQSDRGGLCSFRTIGRLVNHSPRSTTPFEPPSTSTIHFDHRFEHQQSTSLTVAGSGFRTIGRLVNHPPRSTTSNHQIHQSDRGGLCSFRTIGRLVNHSPRSTTPFEPPSTSTTASSTNNPPV
ncbi:hypothetical protein PENPOL_c004G05686 [Penicillium polonicum]|uniref:Uncharacterized protein n=1 Tax=Penicillium polonicum TaxID=60169 RepID=A0A1V6NQG2_PENPO|nr:hypothetical protein PENPOL_c004G05686 [Penicillium polonicum]